MTTTETVCPICKLPATGMHDYCWNRLAADWPEDTDDDDKDGAW